MWLSSKSVAASLRVVKQTQCLGNRLSKEGSVNATHQVVKLKNAAARPVKQTQCLGSRLSKEASVHATHHVVELNECGCMSLMTDAMSEEQKEANVIATHHVVELSG